MPNGNEEEVPNENDEEMTTEGIPVGQFPLAIREERPLVIEGEFREIPGEEEEIPWEELSEEEATRREAYRRYERGPFRGFGASSREREYRAEAPEEIAEMEEARRGLEIHETKKMLRGAGRVAKATAIGAGKGAVAVAKFLGKREEPDRYGRPRRGPTRYARLLAAPGIKAKTIPGAAPGIYEVSPRTIQAGQVIAPRMTLAGTTHAPGMVPAAATHALELSGMRRLTMPGGLNEAEEAAFLEVHRNGDTDSRQHIVSELGEENISRQEASRAVTTLVKIGAIQPTGETSEGKPVYEINPSLLG